MWGSDLRQEWTMPGGVPFVDLARQHAAIADGLKAAFDRVMTSSAFVLGEEVEQFEAEFAAYCGVRHCVGVASGTAALTIMLQGASIGPGDEVIVPAHTFIATALAVQHAGAVPVCVDVAHGSGLIDPEMVRAAMGPRTAAILAVHLYGQACAIEPLRALAHRHGLLLLEDAAQAHGATYRGTRAGALGNAAAFSFFPSKNLGALGDGGAICTNDDGLAAAARRLRNLGRDMYGVHRVGGYNERLDGLQAAFLRVKLPRLDEWTAARRAIAAMYVAGLDDEVEALEESDDSPCTYHVFPIRLTKREGLRQDLTKAGISTRIHYPRALPDQPALHNRYSTRSVVTARDWASRELSVPIFPGMTRHEVNSVVQVVNEHIRARRMNRHVPSERRTGAGHVAAGI
jgi:dTDP-4-amino-4,6-dideoxygalactose transaminase